MVEYLKNNIPQCQIAKALQISSSKVFYGKTSTNLSFLLEIMDDVLKGI